MLTVTLSWPKTPLWPNRKAHWAKLRHARKVQLHEAKWAAHGELGRADPPASPLSVRLTFHPPSRGRRDEDNMVAAMKGALDGLAQALGVDDSEFRLSIEVGEVRKGGSVVVTVEGV